MKTIEQIAAAYRKNNGNETRVSKIKPGHIGFKGITADDVRQEVVRQSELAQKRRDRKHRKTVRQWIKTVWRKKLAEIAYHLPDQGYSMGGERKVCLRDRFGNLIAAGRYEDKAEYSGSTRYSATHGYYEVDVSLSDLHQFRYVGGLVTFVKNSDKIAPAAWIESEGKKQHFKTKRMTGYITADFHADSYEEARAWRDKKAARLREERAQRRKDKERAKNLAKAKNRAKMMFYGYEHARNTGLCRAGIEGFAREVGIDTEAGYRGDILLVLAEREGTRGYIEKIITDRARQLIK